MQLMEQLLDWSPVVVALDGAFPKICELGFKVDYWLGDFDSSNPKEAAELEWQDSVEIVQAPDQNKTDLEKGIEFLMEKGASEVNIVWADGKRLDHMLSNMSSLVKYSKLVKLVLWNDWSKVYVLPRQFEKWFAKGTILSLLPAPKAEAVSTKGLKYSLQNEDLEFGIRTGSSNEASTDGMVSIQHQEGNLILVEAWD